MEAEMVGFLPKIAAPSSSPASSSLILKRLAIIEMAEGAVKWKGREMSTFNFKLKKKSALKESDVVNVEKRAPRRGGVRMKRSFPPRFYRERRDIPTLSVPSKKGAFMHDRARNERRRAYGSRENGVETSSRPWGVLLRGGLA